MSLIRYVFREEPLAILNAKKANPQKIGEALEAVAQAASGRLTPRAVVEAARDKRSPLHRHFEWRDDVAAERWRQDQARELIRVVRVIDDETDEHVRAFLSIKEGGAGTSYRSAAEVSSSVSLQLAVLKSAERDLLAFEQRYRELLDICDSVRVAREKAATKRVALEARA